MHVFSSTSIFTFFLSEGIIIKKDLSFCAKRGTLGLLYSGLCIKLLLKMLNLYVTSVFNIYINKSQVLMLLTLIFISF